MATRKIISICPHCRSEFSHSDQRQTFCSHHCANTSRRTPLLDRFQRFIGVTGGPDHCWLWQGALNGKYGYIGLGGKDGSILAHRAAWIIANGAIPDGLFVLHRCDVPLCVNPAHLFLGTQFENIHDMMAKGRDAFTGEKHYGAKLTADLVREIRQSPDSAAAWARRLGLAPQTIEDVRSRRNWRHVR